MKPDEVKAKKWWQFGTRSLFLGIVIAAVIAISIGPYVRSFLSSVIEQVATAPNMNEPMSRADIESMPLHTKQLWSLMNEGKLLGRRATEVGYLFDAATKVIPLSYGKTGYVFDFGDQTINEGRIPCIWLVVGRNGLILRCGTGATVMPN